jgi:hypothetical protein
MTSLTLRVRSALGSDERNKGGEGREGDGNRLHWSGQKELAKGMQVPVLDVSGSFPAAFKERVRVQRGIRGGSWWRLVPGPGIFSGGEQGHLHVPDVFQTPEQAPRSMATVLRRRQKQGTREETEDAERHTAHARDCDRPRLAKRSGGCSFFILHRVTRRLYGSLLVPRLSKISAPKMRTHIDIHIQGLRTCLCLATLLQVTTGIDCKTALRIGTYNMSAGSATTWQHRLL